MKKKVIIGVTSTVLALILIAVCTFFGIVLSKDFGNDINFLGNSYSNSLSDGKSVDIRIASYNIKSGYNTKENLVAIREQIKKHGVDIVGLQEIDSDNAPRSKSMKVVSTMASDVYSHHFYASTDSTYLGKNYGIMTMSKHALKEADKFFLPMPNKMFTIGGEPRVVVRSIVNIDGIDIAFYNTHLSFENDVKMENGNEMRAEQMKFIFDLMESDPCEHRVLVGDMNILGFDEYDIFASSGHYNLVNNAKTNYVSYRGDDCDFKCLDNIIYSNNMTFVASSMVDNDLSDHNMLFAHLRIE